MYNLVAQLEHAERFKRWITAGQSFERILGQEATIQTQGLGRLDAELIWADENAERLADTEDQLQKMVWSDAGYRLTLSRLWVFGGYELVRCLDEAIKDSPVELKAIKKMFARIRMPLAKYQAAKAFEASDFDVAMPVFHMDLGAGWSTADGVFITRRALGDGLLDLGCSTLNPTSRCS